MMRRGSWTPGFGLYDGPAFDLGLMAGVTSTSSSSSCSSSCAHVDIVLDVGPDFDLVGIASSSSSVDVICVTLIGEASADFTGDLSADQT